MLIIEVVIFANLIDILEVYKAVLKEILHSYLEEQRPIASASKLQ